MKFNRKTFFALFALLALFGQPFAASGPLIQITEYSTVPADVYPGTFGYLQLTLSNKGDTTAQSINAYYTFEGIGSSVSVGDISAGSTAKISVPFKIASHSAGSIQLLNVDIYYTYESGASSPTKKASVSVPLTVKQYRPLEAKTVSIDKSAIAPGEKITLELELRNTGGVVNNLIITAPTNSSFFIDGSTQKAIGSIPLNSTLKTSLTLASSSDTSTGTYSVPVIFTYQDALKQPTEETLNIGPISVLESSSQYRMLLEPQEPVEIGSQVPFRLTLENAGSSPMSGSIDINATGVFTPIGVQRIYFDSVQPGASVSKEVTIGVASSTSAGYYTLPIRLTPHGGQPATYNIGIAVSATPEITVTLDSSSGATSVQVANTGNSQVRSVYVMAKAASSQSASESFMGTLNVDDFASLALASATGGNIEVEIRFRDTNNIEHVMRETLESSSVVFSGAPNGTLSGASAFPDAASTRMQQRNPLSMLFGGGRGTAASSGGIDPLLIVGVVAVAGAVGYFAYRKYFRKPKAKQ